MRVYMPYYGYDYEGDCSLGVFTTPSGAIHCLSSQKRLGDYWGVRSWLIDDPDSFIDELEVTALGDYEERGIEMIDPDPSRWPSN